MLRTLLLSGMLLGIVSAVTGRAEDTAPSPPSEDAALPYVYTKWQQFGTDAGLPNDHIFAICPTSDAVWIGTEDGLVRYEKKTARFRAWREADGLPWRVVSAIDVDPKTGDVWLGLFGGGLARFSAGRFDHFTQLNSGLVNDVVYGVAVENDHVWAATTAGASRYDVKTGEWTMFTEKNSPMEEIWNYGVDYAPEAGKVFLAVWGSGCLEFDIKTERWKVYLDPDHEMEIDLYRDDGIIHVITTAVDYCDGALWISTYFGNCRYDGRHWRGYYADETGLPSDFTNGLAARSADEAWMATDKGLGQIADFATDTVVAYRRVPDAPQGTASIYRRGRLIKEISMPLNVPHNHITCVAVDGNDLWVGTAKGLARAVGDGYYPGLRPVEADTHSEAATVATDTGE